MKNAGIDDAISMVMILMVLVIGILALAWLWKVPVKGVVRALKKSGSSTFEAYGIVVLLLGGSIAVVYIIWEVL